MDRPPKKKLLSTPIQINTPEVKPETTITDLSELDPSSPVFTNKDSLKTDNEKLLDFQEIEALPTREYSRISMRVLKQTKEKLASIKSETNVPVEVIVDVMVGVWDDFPNRLKEKIVKLARGERNKRLIEGQEKSMQTALKRLKQL